MAIQNMEAFRVSPYATGLDLNRSQIKESLGNYIVDETTPTTIYAGMLVQQNVGNQLIEVCTGAIPFGFAKYNRATAVRGVVVGEYVRVYTGVAAQLSHTNIWAPNANDGVRVAAALTDAAYTLTTDYTIQSAAGTITNAGVGIADGAYVYVNYTYTLSTAELALHGQNFWNSQDDAQYQAGRFTVITDWSTLFTTAYDTAGTYIVGMQLYAGRTAKNKSGYVCADNTEGLAYIGRCFQIPTANDPYLGVKFVGGMVA